MNISYLLGKRQREKSDSDGEEVETFSVLVEIVEAALKPLKNSPSKCDPMMHELRYFQRLV